MTLSLASTLRIVAKHVNACADELDGQEPKPSIEDQAADIAEKRRRLRESG